MWNIINVNARMWRSILNTTKKRQKEFMNANSSYPPQITICCMPVRFIQLVYCARNKKENTPKFSRQNAQELTHQLQNIILPARLPAEPGLGLLPSDLGARSHFRCAVSSDHQPSTFAATAQWKPEWYKGSEAQSQQSLNSKIWVLLDQQRTNSNIQSENANDIIEPSKID